MPQPSRTTGRIRRGSQGFKDFLFRVVEKRTRARDRPQFVDSWAFDMKAGIVQGGAGGTGAEPPPTDNSPGVWQVKDITVAHTSSTDITLGLSADCGSARGFFTAKRGTNFMTGLFFVLHDGTTGQGQLIGGITAPTGANIGLTITGVVSGGNFILRSACDSIDTNTTKINYIFHSVELQT